MKWVKRVLILTLFVLALLAQLTIADESSDVDGTNLTQEVSGVADDIVDETRVKPDDTE